jgi:hypothetical protein
MVPDPAQPRRPPDLPLLDLRRLTSADVAGSFRLGAQ